MRTNEKARPQWPPHTDLSEDIHREFQEGYRNEVLSEIPEKPRKNPQTYAHQTKKNRLRQTLIDGMDSICAQKGERAQSRAKYYDSYDWKKTDPDGSYTGVPTEPFGSEPVQDADDL